MGEAAAGFLKLSRSGHCPRQFRLLFVNQWNAGEYSWLWLSWSS